MRTGIACIANYGWDAMEPGLAIEEEDLIVCGARELYSPCKELGITTLVYAGGATNLCVTSRSEGLASMANAGLECIVARDLVEAWSRYDPGAQYTPEMGNEIAAGDLERCGIPTVHMVDELRRLKLWEDGWITEPVRLAPWGTRQRPYFFWEGKPLRIRGKSYERGVGMRAPSELAYRLAGEWGRFVGRAGIDDGILDVANGRSTAMYPNPRTGDGRRSRGRTMRRRGMVPRLRGRRRLFLAAERQNRGGRSGGPCVGLAGFPA